MAGKISFNRLTAILLSSWIGACPSGWAAPVSHPVREKSRALESVVALTPALASICYDILPDGEDHRVVGVSVSTQPPPGQKPLEVASSTAIAHEKLVALKPSLILFDPQWGKAPLVAGGVGISTARLSDISAAYRRVGALLLHPLRGEELARLFEKGLQELRGVLSGSFFFQLDADPLVAVGGKGDFLPELLTWLGVRNIFAQTAQAYPRVSEEAVVSKNPDFILVLGLRAERKKFEGLALRWGRRHPGLQAVQKNQVKVVDADELTLPSAGLIRGAQALVALVKAGSR
ncbi:MAG: ABC transporter substrate-binding protein [Oligoflexia bacterium]